MSLATWSGLEQRLIPYADAALRMGQQLGLHPQITSVRRNWAEQEKLYHDFQHGLRQLPANPPGYSAHQYGVAWDSWVPDVELQLWNQVRGHFGWKLYPNDPVHAELPGWERVTKFLKLT